MNMSKQDASHDPTGRPTIILCLILFFFVFIVIPIQSKIVVAFAVLSLIYVSFRTLDPKINEILKPNKPYELTRRHLVILNLILFFLSFFMVPPLQSTENINRIFDAPALFQLGAISLLVVTFIKENKRIENDRLLTFGSYGILWFFGAGFVAMYLTIFSSISNIVIESAKLACIYLGGLNLCSAGREIVVISKPEEKHGRNRRN